MHELSIALELIDIASAEAARMPDVTIDALHVRIGPLSGVVKSALLFSFELAAAGSPIEGARLEFEDVPIVLFCPGCGCEQIVESPQHLRCPRCHALSADIRQGRDLELTALEVRDHVAADR